MGVWMPEQSRDKMVVVGGTLTVIYLLILWIFIAAISTIQCGGRGQFDLPDRSFTHIIVYEIKMC
jgi:hypothetical protein